MVQVFLHDENFFRVAGFIETGKLDAYVKDYVPHESNSEKD